MVASSFQGDFGAHRGRCVLRDGWINDCRNGPSQSHFISRLAISRATVVWVPLLGAMASGSADHFQKDTASDKLVLKASKAGCKEGSAAAGAQMRVDGLRAAMEPPQADATVPGRCAANARL
jgi:hypothetical protein